MSVACPTTTWWRDEALLPNPVCRVAVPAVGDRVLWHGDHPVLPSAHVAEERHADRDANLLGRGGGVDDSCHRDAAQGIAASAHGGNRRRRHRVHRRNAAARRRRRVAVGIFLLLFAPVAAHTLFLIASMAQDFIAVNFLY